MSPSSNFKMTTKVLEKIGINRFFGLLVLMVILSYSFPFYGTEDSPLPLHSVIKYGMPLIFFFYGVRLSPEELRAGLGKWKLHVLIQSTTFIIFPCIVLAFVFLKDDQRYHELWLGTFYLATLPSTVSSSVVLVSIARGNIAAAIFNASLSSIIGVFITPVWMNIFIQNTSSVSNLSEAILKLCLQVLAPVIVGFLLHKRLGLFAKKHRDSLTKFDQSIILLIVFTAFSTSFYNGHFNVYSATKIVMLAIVMLLFFLFMFGLMYSVSVLLKFSREDRITVLFCGSKKSLVQGALMSSVLFPPTFAPGVILLPLMLYHALQLMAGSTIAQKMAQ